MPTTFAKSELTHSDFLQGLLAEQADLSAVERFSSLHDAQLLDGRSADPQQPDQARYYQSLMPATTPSPLEQYAFEVDLDACSGCKACVVACHTLNGLEEEESWRRVGVLMQNTDLPQLKFVSTACHHCVDPGCLNGCPVMAYDKDPATGIVRHLDDQCIGCKYCTMMCPYEVPQYSSRLGIVRKCDMCHQRLQAGEAPACVQACPNEAISIRKVAREFRVGETERLVAGAPLSSITKPTTQFKSKHAQFNVHATAQDDQLDHPEEAHWPLVGMLVGTQASVGILLAERGLTAIHSLAGESTLRSHTLLASIFALGFAIVGLGVAPLHLGQPWRAWRVFLGLRTSWLSREAILLGKYLVLLVASVAVLASASWLPNHYLTQTIPPAVGSLLLALTLVCGCAGLVSSAMIYIATRRSLWSYSWTFIRFLGTAIVLGCAATAAVTGSVALAALACFAAASKICWEWQAYLSPQRPQDDRLQVRGRQLVRMRLNGLRNLRLYLGIVGTVVVGVGSGLLLADIHPWSPIVLAAATGILCVGEIAERALYFSGVVFDRMPGALP